MCDPNMLQLLITNYQCRFTVFLTCGGKFVGIYPWTSSDQNLVPCGAQDAPGSHWSPNCFQAAATSALHLLLPCSTKTRFRRLAFTTQTTLCSGVWGLTVYKPLQQHLLHRPLQGCKNIHIFNLHCIPNVMFQQTRGLSHIVLPGHLPSQDLQYGEKRVSFVSHEVFLIFVKKVPFETDLLYCIYRWYNLSGTYKCFLLCKFVSPVTPIVNTSW